MKMRTRWIKYVIWLATLSATCTLGAVIQPSETPSSTPQTITSTANIIAQNRDRPTPNVTLEDQKNNASVETPETSFRNEKAQSNATAIGESIKMVASQLLHSNKTPPPPSTSGKQGIVTDTRTPPSMKNQQVKTKAPNKPVIKTDEPKRIENSHAGVAIPVSHEDMEKEIEIKIQTHKRKPIVKETSTTGEGLSTWVLVNGKPTPTTLKPEVKSKNESLSKGETVTQAPKENKKPPPNKPKPTPKPTPQIKPIFIRKPVAISSNKSDLIASGSAVNENEMNKIKASVLANVQKNAALGKTTTSSEIIVSSTDNIQNVKEKVKDTSKEIMIKINQVNLKDKKKSEAKEKQSVKQNEISKVDHILQDEIFESKQAEIELPVSTPAPATKVKSKKKKNKNRRRKPSTSSTKLETKDDDTKVNKKVKVNKNDQNTTNIYNFISRKVIPSVGIGLVSLAGLFGIASYFFNPFTTIRRSDSMIERKDLYHYNEENYADDGGQREEDVLGNLFPDVSADNKVQSSNIRQSPLNPTQFTYPKPKTAPSSTEQNIRYRHVGYGSETNNFVSNDRIGPKSPDIVQGSAYSEKIHYDTHSADNREPYAVYPQPQPVYKAPDRQVASSEYSADVYHAISPYAGHHQLSEPTYGQPLRYNDEMFETSKSPISNVVHLNEEDVIEHQKETGYTVDALTMDDEQEPQFVVGNVPKELIQATPVTVPEHGPRSLKIRKRSIDAAEPEARIESAAESLKQILSTAQKRDDDEMSNEIDDVVMNVYHKNTMNSNTLLDSYRNETIKNYPNDEDTTSEKITPDSMTKPPENSNDTANASTEFTKLEHNDTDTPVFTSSTENPKNDEYPYYNHQYPILDLIRGFLDFKLRLGISILKATSENLARYLKDVENNFNITTPQARSRFR